eukprot:6172033-Pleurochrysis_carterae.AAC.2
MTLFWHATKAPRPDPRPPIRIWAGLLHMKTRWLARSRERATPCQPLVFETKRSSIQHCVRRPILVAVEDTPIDMQYRLSRRRRYAVACTSIGGSCGKNARRHAARAETL